MPVYEIEQATGAAAQALIAAETVWGNVAVSPNVKRLPLPPGETADINMAIYQSNVIRSDGMRNKQVRGTQRPGGSIPFELAPLGQAQLFYQLLGWRVSTTGTGPYVHVLKGNNRTTAWPQGFTYEKAFLDLATAKYIPFKGCRINGCTLNFNVDSMVTGAFDFIAREVLLPQDISVFAGEGVDDMTSDPFTSVQITLYEGSSLAVLGTAEQLSLSIVNNIRDKFVLGSNYRANAKRGTRVTSGTGTFLFQDEVLYEKAITGEDTKIQITASNGVYSYDFLMPNVDWIPNNSTPKITDDGPLSITLGFDAAKSEGDGTDIIVTITSPEDEIHT